MDDDKSYIFSKSLNDYHLDISNKLDKNSQQTIKINWTDTLPASPPEHPKEQGYSIDYSYVGCPIKHAGFSVLNVHHRTQFVSGAVIKLTNAMGKTVLTIQVSYEEKDQIPKDEFEQRIKSVFETY